MFRGRGTAVLVLQLDWFPSLPLVIHKDWQIPPALSAGPHYVVNNETAATDAKKILKQGDTFKRSLQCWRHLYFHPPPTPSTLHPLEGDVVQLVSENTEPLKFLTQTCKVGLRKRMLGNSDVLTLRLFRVSA